MNNFSKKFIHGPIIFDMLKKLTNIPKYANILNQAEWLEATVRK